MTKIDVSEINIFKGLKFLILACVHDRPGHGAEQESGGRHSSLWLHSHSSLQRKQPAH
jgi:hypothetical protein